MRGGVGLRDDLDVGREGVVAAGVVGVVVGVDDVRSLAMASAPAAEGLAEG